MPRQKKFSCISLFTGCGGLDIGLEKAGFDIVAATDIEKTCELSYKLNYPQKNFLVGPISKITTKQLLEAAGLKKGELDLLAGGPPCPAFSKSRFYRKEKPRALDDPVASETVGGYLRVLKEARPKTFILENVKGLAYGIHKQALDHIIKSAADLGYNVDWYVVNAANYGVPQIRERCIVIGSLYGKVAPIKQTHYKPDAKLKDQKNWRTAGDVLLDLQSAEIKEIDGHFAGGKYHKELQKVPPGDNYLYFTKERGYKKPIFKWRSRYWSFLLKLSPEMPSWTIQARRSNNMGPFHWNSRILTISEIKRLQTFPDDYHLFGTAEKQWRQIGNAVPPELAKKIGLSIAKHIRENQ